jgi:hypothetical protein
VIKYWGDRDEAEGQKTKNINKRRMKERKKFRRRKGR